ncbi:retinol dehydrogenase 14-like [Acipenser ruthenus]|uniref:retinol dehydrogenase 14-like n=1 Tax=Acipenser ruthenus TaxID=7906 RepID=UPI00145AED58|nr:retinol dehydrogenase 14-like [Acipenser ruthenus]
MYVLGTVVASLVCFLLLKWTKKRRFCLDTKRLHGKTVLITGGHCGIGKETAIGLAVRGARVIIACRDAGKAEEAVREIRRASCSMNVQHMELDLANLQSIRDFSEALLKREKRLDVLINNAGMPCVLDWTDDGFSMCFGFNHLGHFLLTNLLLGRLKESAPSRVISLTSSMYKYQKLDFQDLNYNIVPFFTYCRSKLANIYFTQELARMMEGKGVTAYSVHPGFVHSNWTSHFSTVFRMLLWLVMVLFSVPCEAAAQTVIHCAVADEVLQHNGKFFFDCQPAKLHPFAEDEGAAKKLWEASERMVNLT